MKNDRQEERLLTMLRSSRDPAEAMRIAAAIIAAAAAGEKGAAPAAGAAPQNPV